MYYKTRFLEKLVLGRKTNFSESGNVVQQCIKKAYQAMLAGGRFSGIKKNIIAEFTILLENSNYEFSTDLIQKTKEKIICAEENAFGLAQKIVNMTFKYFFVFKKYIDRKIDFSNCHCPLDENILKTIGEDASWTKIDFDTYKKCQEKISKKLKEKKIPRELENTGNLAFDFLVW